jgi:hypothetical protein
LKMLISAHFVSFVEQFIGVVPESMLWGKLNSTIFDVVISVFHPALAGLVLILIQAFNTQMLEAPDLTHQNILP